MRHFIFGLVASALSVMAGVQSLDAAEQPFLDSQKQLVEQAEAVALVRITHVNSLINHALSRPGMLSVQGYSYQLSVSRLWKGEAGKSDELRIDLNSCTQRLQKGEHYIVMMQVSDSGWVSDDCEQVVAVAQAQPLLAYLNSHYSAPLAGQALAQQLMK